MDLKNKTALVTGGASGLGEATVRAFHAAGANTVILDLNDARGTALAAELGDTALYINTDVTNEDALDAAMAAVKTRFGGLHIAVNCAGLATPAKILDREGKRTPFSYYRKIIEVNLIGTYQVLAASAELMQHNTPEGDDMERGVIINTASVAAIEGQIGQGAYASSKGGVASLALPAARELARSGIRVMTIAPGFIHTPLFDGLPEKAVESLKEQVVFPKRLGKPAEYAKLACHIVENAYLNGEIIRMDAAARMAPK